MILTAERIIIDGEPRAGAGIEVGFGGQIVQIGDVQDLGRPHHDLKGRVLLPGLINAHSQVIEGLRYGGKEPDRRRSTTGPLGLPSFALDSQFDSEAMYIVARQAFIEMLLRGVTAVGKLHVVHHQADGTPYADTVCMGEALARAAVDTGIRASILRGVALRGESAAPPEGSERRLYDRSLDEAWNSIETLITRLRNLGDARITWGLAAPSLAATSFENIIALKTCASHLPLHIRASMSRGEIEAFIDTHGASPVRLLSRRGIIDSTTTLVGATHLQAGEAAAVAKGGAMVCFCPSVDPWSGQGYGSAAVLQAAGASLCVGTGGILPGSVLEEARRMVSRESGFGRVRTRDAAAARLLWRIITTGGARSLDLQSGLIAPDTWADFVSFDLEDPDLAGQRDEDLLAAVVFKARPEAIRDVIVGGERVVENGYHRLAAQSAEAYATLSRKSY